MNALIFLAHGSRREKSNKEVVDLVDAMRPRLAQRFGILEAAFLELVPPSLDDAIRSAIASGARSVTIYPFFLNSGKHVDKDIPEIVDAFKARHPECEFRVKRHFGASQEVPDMIVTQLDD